MQDGFVPNDFELIGDLAKRICYETPENHSNWKEKFKLTETFKFPKVYILKEPIK